MQLGKIGKDTLQSKLVVMLALFAIFSAGIVGGVNVYLGLDADKRNVLESNRTVATQIAGEITQFMQDARGMTETLAVSPVMYSMDAAKIREMIINAQQKNPQFELIYAMDTGGMQIARTSGNLANRADRPYFKGAIGGNTFFTDVYISSFTKAPTVTISTPIKDPAGNILGVLAADISLKAVWEMAERTAIGKTGYVEIVDNKGTLIAAQDKERVSQSENIADYAYVKQVLQGETGYSQEKSATKVDSLISFAPVAAYKWGVITYLSEREVLEGVYRSLAIMALLTCLIALGALTTALVMAKKIAKPIKGLVQEAERMAHGDLRHPIAAEGVAEVRQLAVALETMKNSLKTIVADIAQSTDQIAASSEQFQATAGQSAQAAEQIAVSITGVASGAAEQIKAVDNMFEAVQQMAGRIQQVATGSDQVSNHSTDAVNSARTGGTAVEQAVQQMNKIEETVTHSAGVVQQLGDKSKEIGQIVDTIAAIAGQTNLLALNAAIEAARAGEQGRGFSVVAEEVRKLAEQSQEATGKIAALITEIQGETHNAVVAMSQGTREVELGAQVVHTAGDAFIDITGIIEQVSEQIQEISESIRLIAAGSEQMVMVVQDIDELSRRAAGEAETVSAATEEQSAAMEEIAASSTTLAQTAYNLQQAVEKFKL